MTITTKTGVASTFAPAAQADVGDAAEDQLDAEAAEAEALEATGEAYANGVFGRDDTTQGPSAAYANAPSGLWFKRPGDIFGNEEFSLRSGPRARLSKLDVLFGPDLVANVQPETLSGGVVKKGMTRDEFVQWRINYKNDRSKSRAARDAIAISVANTDTGTLKGKVITVNIGPNLSVALDVAIRAELLVEPVKVGVPYAKRTAPQKPAEQLAALFKGVEDFLEAKSELESRGIVFEPDGRELGFTIDAILQQAVVLEEYLIERGELKLEHRHGMVKITTELVLLLKKSFKKEEVEVDPYWVTFMVHLAISRLKAFGSDDFAAAIRKRFNRMNYFTFDKCMDTVYDEIDQVFTGTDFSYPFINSMAQRGNYMAAYLAGRYFDMHMKQLGHLAPVIKTFDPIKAILEKGKRAGLMPQEDLELYVSLAEERFRAKFQG